MPAAPFNVKTWLQHILSWCGSEHGAVAFATALATALDDDGACTVRLADVASALYVSTNTARKYRSRLPEELLSVNQEPGKPPTYVATYPSTPGLTPQPQAGGLNPSTPELTPQPQTGGVPLKPSLEASTPPASRARDKETPLRGVFERERESPLPPLEAKPPLPTQPDPLDLSLANLARKLIQQRTGRRPQWGSKITWRVQLRLHGLDATNEEAVAQLVADWLAFAETWALVPAVSHHKREGAFHTGVAASFSQFLDDPDKYRATREQWRKDHAEARGKQAPKSSPAMQEAEEREIVTQLLERAELPRAGGHGKMGLEGARHALGISRTDFAGLVSRHPELRATA